MTTTIFDVTPEEEAGNLEEIIYGYKDVMVVSRKAIRKGL